MVCNVSLTRMNQGFSEKREIRLGRIQEARTKFEGVDLFLKLNKSLITRSLDERQFANTVFCAGSIA
jgi:hypothetical protein